MRLRVFAPYKLISHENANIRKLYFIIACNIYFFQIFRVEIMSENFLYNWNLLWRSLLPENRFYQVHKITYFFSHSEDISRVGLIVKDSVIICETIKWVFGTALFGGDFCPRKTILGK